MCHPCVTRVFIFWEIPWIALCFLYSCVFPTFPSPSLDNCLMIVQPFINHFHIIFLFNPYSNCKKWETTFLIRDLMQKDKVTCHTCQIWGDLELCLDPRSMWTLPVLSRSLKPFSSLEGFFWVSVRTSKKLVIKKKNSVSDCVQSAWEHLSNTRLPETNSHVMRNWGFFLVWVIEKL